MPPKKERIKLNCDNCNKKIERLKSKIKTKNFYSN